MSTIIIASTPDADETGQLYDLRVQNLKEWLARPDISFSPAEENFLISQYEAMETPLYYEYNDGWIP